LVVLLALLGIAIAALAYDYLYAGPGVEADDKKLEAFVDESNRQSVDKSKRLTADEIHKVLGRGPTWVDKHPSEYYEVEYYCKWGMVPVLNMRRHYLAVVYVGDEPRRYNSHYKNERPPVEALPIQPKGSDDTGEVAPPTNDATPTKDGQPAAADGAAAATPDSAPAEGAKKRKGKKKQEATEDKSDQPQEEKKDN